MPLDLANSTAYSFNRNYDDLPVVNLPFRYVESQFNTHDYACLGTIQVYTNEQDTIKFYPDFETTYEKISGFNNVGVLTSETGGFAATPFIDNYRYYFDFGDGTISDSLTAEHFYKIPGEYLVTLVCVDSATNFYRSLQFASISAINVIPDEIYLSYTDGNSAIAGSLMNPMLATRYNSYQSWPSVSAAGGYTINLTVSGNKSEFVDPNKYYRDPNAHLKKFSAFLQDRDGELTVVDTLSTTNSFIYAKRQRISNVLQDWFLSTTPEENSIFVGTSGYGEFYYYED